MIKNKRVCDYCEGVIPDDSQRWEVTSYTHVSDIADPSTLDMCYNCHQRLLP